MKKAAHMTTRAMRSLAARDDDFEASSGRRGVVGGACEVVSSCTVLIR